MWVNAMAGLYNNNDRTRCTRSRAFNYISRAERSEPARLTPISWDTIHICVVKMRGRKIHENFTRIRAIKRLYWLGNFTVELGARLARAVMSASSGQRVLAWGCVEKSRYHWPEGGRWNPPYSVMNLDSILILAVSRLSFFIPPSRCLSQSTTSYLLSQKAT